MNGIREGWFSEVNALWPGQCMSLEVEEVLLHEKSPFQDVMMLKTKHHGNALILDGVIQVTESDEFSYHEIGSNVPLNAHPNPEKVLIIGGGDGGMAREVCRNPAVKSVTQCEIDELVVNACKKYLPNLAVGFDDPKMNLIIGDGFDFMGKHKGEFDVIITDSSDPFGPAKVLFEKPYYQLMMEALRPGGIIASQGECLWLHLDLIRDMFKFCREIFPVVDYTTVSVPTYPSGQIGFMLCSLNPETNFRKPVRTFTDEEIETLGLKYYNTEMHAASFVLPHFAKKVLEGKAQK
ncbi:hypothetical protein CAPTEDRAFT_156944 [Capitella teleta]|uniref:Spermidine synthase n=1 Tax=Capitella teleta TaxID=283909 RepID=R7T990_CAPTE|nr:hypothetical protein CAPTEDRAFT_156944 [Capitella teleta]|eukprot:ELT87970.1 hypothetical protein CAPTEDRAFT_156944 [Capitella teleta]